MGPTPQQPTPGARSLADALSRLRQEAPVAHPLLDLAERGDIEMEHLRRLVGVELRTHRAELATYGTMIARYPHHPTTGLYLAVARLVHEAHFKLRDCATALGIPAERIGEWPSGVDALAFGNYISWLALHGGQADNALALYCDMTVYFPGCTALVERLRDTDLKVPPEFVDYYAGGQSDELERQALEVVQYGLDHGEDGDVAVRRARLLEEHLGRFWTAAAAG
ncbi:hypothetical protein [Actinomadura flavalba]|uniref:hypothetical protein n=1 Tax=Actinomadura flavalba TaxID=1120938 RepID=UPI00037F25BA|nr:hypothetical protein [Actinomadura flavalba]